MKKHSEFCIKPFVTKNPVSKLRRDFFIPSTSSGQAFIIHNSHLHWRAAQVSFSLALSSPFQHIIRDLIQSQANNLTR